jgi:hypothetical protein
MSLKYPNQLKISLNNYQKKQVKVLSMIHGMSQQDVIRKAIDAFARTENERLMSSNPNGTPLPGF